MKLADLRRELKKAADPAKAAGLQRFFKTGPGEYAEGDRFRGIRVPVVRALVRRCGDLPFSDVLKLLSSRWHEDRLLALLLMVRTYDRADEKGRRKIYETYLSNTRCINNWDLVDVTAEHVVGRHLANRSRRPLHRLARSKNLWERRISILSTFHFIRRGDFGETLRLADRLLGDPEDLIHKAVGWMVREVGNRDRRTEEAFLRERYHRMPRTMLRYAIERFPEPLRKRYLQGRV